VSLCIEYGLLRLHYVHGLWLGPVRPGVGPLYRRGWLWCRRLPGFSYGSWTTWAALREVEFVHPHLGWSAAAGFLLMPRERRPGLAPPPAPLVLGLLVERLCSQPLRSYHSTAVLPRLSWADWGDFKYRRLMHHTRAGGGKLPTPAVAEGVPHVDAADSGCYRIVECLRLTCSLRGSQCKTEYDDGGRSPPQRNFIILPLHRIDLLCGWRHGQRRLRNYSETGPQVSVRGTRLPLM
jgi:hypothetical protein